MKSSNKKRIRQNATIYLRRLRRMVVKGSIKKTEIHYAI